MRERERKKERYRASERKREILEKKDRKGGREGEFRENTTNISPDSITNILCFQNFKIGIQEYALQHVHVHTHPHVNMVHTCHRTCARLEILLLLRVMTRINIMIYIIPRHSKMTVYPNSLFRLLYPTQTRRRKLATLRKIRVCVCVCFCVDGC